MKSIFNKQVMVTFAIAVILPIVGMMAMGYLVQRFNPAPASVPAVVDSGERWYNPFSWQNDELAAISHQQAEAAQANSVGFTSTTALVIMGAVGLGLALVYGAGDVRKEVALYQLTEGHKEDSGQLPPDRSNADGDAGDEILNRAARGRHPAAAGA